MTAPKKPTTLEDALKRIEKLEEDAKSAARGVDNLSSALGKFTSTGAKSRAEVGNISTAYADMQAVLDNTKSVINGLTKGMSGLLDKIPGIGPIAGGAVKAIGGIASAFGSLAGAVAAAPKAFITALDDQTRGLRQFESELFDLNKRFGGSIEETKRFADGLRKASSNELAKSLHMTTGEMANFVRATADTQLTQEQLSQTVQTGAGVIELYGAATAFAESTSMSLGRAADMLNVLMNKQGKSAQEATNMMGMYIGVSEETGLSVDKVSTSLNSAVSQFAKIGMAADFGKPIMEGFAKTMSDMSLGIEESVALSEDLTKSLASLTNNYGMAHLMFQRGGLDIGGGGGGGVLGSSIALQSAYLDAEKTGDQSAIGDQLVRGMRDTLASFTGGDIVTVQQANEDSSLQNQFYIQQQMLKSSFGISDDNSAARVLDMLSRLDEATRSGDVEAQDKLKEQIAKEKKGRDATLDEMEKVNRKLEVQINLMTVQLRSSLDQTRFMAAATGHKLSSVMPGLAGPQGVVGKGVKGAGDQLKRMADWLGLGKESKSREVLEANWATYQRKTGGRPSGVGEMDANLAIGGINRNLPNDRENLLGILQKQTAFTKGGKIMGADIDKAATQIISHATVAQKVAGGGEAQLRKQLIQEMVEALGTQTVKIEMSDEASNALKAATNYKQSNAALKTGNTAATK